MNFWKISGFLTSSAVGIATLAAASCAVSALASDITVAGVMGGAGAAGIGFTTNCLNAYLEKKEQERNIKKHLDGNTLPVNYDIFQIAQESAVAALEHCADRYEKLKGSEWREFKAIANEEHVARLGMNSLEMKGISKLIDDGLRYHDNGSNIPDFLKTVVEESLFQEVEAAFKKKEREPPEQLKQFLCGNHPDLPGGFFGIYAAYVVESFKVNDRAFRVMVLEMLRSINDKLDTLGDRTGRIELEVGTISKHWQTYSKTFLEELGLQKNTIEQMSESLNAFSKRIECQHLKVLSEFEIDRQPPLITPGKGGGCISPLRFDSRHSPLLGREEQMTALRDFIQDPALVLWQIITGPAGTGKSRLALELCHEFGDSGRMKIGFLSGTEWLKNTLDKWRAPEDTIIILDYASQKVGIDTLGNAIADLADRNAEPALYARVRILLLDRGSYTDEQGLARKLQRQLGDRLEWKGPKCDARPPAFDLEPLEEDDAQTIVQAYYKANLNDVQQDQLRQAWKREPILRRPLFAAMSGLSFRDGLNPEQFTPGTLARHCLEKDRERIWQPKGYELRGKEEKLLALATMARGLPLDKPAEGLPRPTEMRKIFHDMMGNAEEENGFSSFYQPDFLGEYFVCDVLGDYIAEDLMRQVWALGANPGEFLVNLAGDLKILSAGKAAFAKRAQALFTTLPPDEKQKAQWGEMHIFVLFALAGNGLDDIADVVIEKAGEAGIDPGLRATGLFASGLDDELRAHPCAELRLKSLRTLQAAHGGDAAVREWLARALINRAEDLIKLKGDLAGAEKILQDLRDLQVAHPDDAVVQEWLAKALANHARHLALEKDRVGAERILQELRDLQVAHGGDAVVRECLVSALYNHANHLLFLKKGDVIACLKGDLAGAEKILQELRDLQVAHPDDAVVRQKLASALFNRAGCQLKEDLDGAEKILQELRALLPERIENIEPWQRIAEASVKMGEVRRKNNSPIMARLYWQIVLKICLAANAKEEAASIQKAIDRLPDYEIRLCNQL